MSRLFPLAILVSLVALVSLLATQGANGVTDHTVGTLQLHAALYGRYGPTECPPAAPANVSCYFENAQGSAPGLGAAEQRFTLFYEMPGDCGLWRARDVTLTITGKGVITATAANTCQRIPSPNETMQFTVTGGSGLYAGATGSGTIAKTGTSGEAGHGTYVWRGAISVPGLDFDTTPPTLTGATSKTVKIARQLRRVRVRFSVTARDAVDGPVPVSCDPPSGSLFKRGRTTVRCTATDTSANTASRAFRVTVTSRRS